MLGLLRQLLFLGLAAILSWWFFLAAPDAAPPFAAPTDEPLVDVAVLPLLRPAPVRETPSEPEATTAEANAKEEPIVELVPAAPLPEPIPDPSKHPLPT